MRVWSRRRGNGLGVAGSRFALVLLSTCWMLVGCVAGDGGSQDMMLDYLESKYGEKFVLESTRTESRIDPSLYGTAGGVAYPESDPSQPFAVVEDPDVAGGFSDDRVLASWAKGLRDLWTPAVRAQLGEGTSVAVLLTSPDSFGLDPSLVNSDPLAGVAQELSASSCALLVMIPVQGTFNADEHTSALFESWRMLQASGIRRPALTAWFVPEDYSDAEEVLRALAVPNFSAGQDDVEGAVAFVTFGESANVASPEDVGSRIRSME